MLYNFIQILIFIVALCCLMSVIFRMSNDDPLVCLVFGFTGFILSIITFVLTIVWAGGWVG
mgnify:FL=1